MATNTKKRQNKKSAKLGEYTVLNPYEFENGDIRFNLRLDEMGVTFYGLRVVAYKKGDFISFPQRKVKTDDGDTYYNHFYINFSDEQQEEIIEAVRDALED